MPFATLDAAKLILGIPSSVTTYDAAITAKVDAVNARLLRYFGLSSTSPTSYSTTLDLDLDGRRRLPLVRIGPYPVITVDSVTVDGSALDSSQYRVRGPHNDVVRFSSPLAGGSSRRALQRGRGAVLDLVAIEVTAGWAGGTPPADLTEAASLWAAQQYKRGITGDLKSERWGRYARTRFTAAELSGHGGVGWPPALTEAMADYMRHTSMPTTSVAG